MTDAEFAYQFFLLVISGIATISILLVLIFLGMFAIDLWSRNWVKKIKSDVEKESAREWSERET
jgi:hypothetical protein